MKKKDSSPYFQTLVTHIHETWKTRKGFGYPFRGRDFKELKTATRNFQEWHLMALWDRYIEDNSEWVKKTGHSISGFLACLCWLVDDPIWKQTARKYENNMALELPEGIKEILKK